VRPTIRSTAPEARRAAKAAFDRPVERQSLRRSHEFAWGLAEVAEVGEIPRGLVDPRLQRFVEAMLTDMLAGPTWPALVP
jgi:hypothetical protein